MGAFFTKGLRMRGSQTNVKRYNRCLRDLIIAGRVKPSFTVSHQLPWERCRMTRPPHAAKSCLRRASISGRPTVGTS